MTIYYIIFIVISIFSIKEKIISKNNIILYYITLYFIIVFLGIRYGVGNDYFTYMTNHEGINGKGNYVSNEPLYLLVNKLLTFELVIFFFAFSSIFFIGKSILFFGKTNNLFLILLLYYCFYFVIFNIHILRQGLSISIVLYSFTFLYNNDIKRCIILIIIASLFHISAIFVLPFVCIINRRIPLNYQLVVLAASLFVAFNSNIFSNFFYALGSQIPILNKYFYFYRSGEMMNYGISIGIMMDIVLLLLFMYRINSLDSKQRFLYNIFYISVILSLLLIINPAALRLNYYFRIINIFMIPLIYNYFRIKPLLLIIIFVLGLLYLITSFNSIGEYGRGDRNLKYKTILDR